MSLDRTFACLLTAPYFQNSGLGGSLRTQAHTVLNGIRSRPGRTERVAILGPSNGTGKTTLFRAINGFARWRQAASL